MKLPPTMQELGLVAKPIKIHNVGNGPWDSVILHENPISPKATNLVKDYYAPQVMGMHIYIYHVRHTHYVVRTPYGMPRGIHNTLNSAINMVKRMIYGHAQAIVDFYNTFPHAVWGSPPTIPHGTWEPWYATLPQTVIPAKNGYGERTHTRMPKWCHLNNIAY
jgi:hypothetical protein